MIKMHWKKWQVIGRWRRAAAHWCKFLQRNLTRTTWSYIITCELRVDHHVPCTTNCCRGSFLQHLSSDCSGECISNIQLFLRGTAICFKLIKLVLDTFDFSLFCIPIFSALYTPSVSFKIALLNISEDISSELHHLIKQKLPTQIQCRQQ